MVARIVVIVVLAGVLAGGLLYSQRRQPLDRVSGFIEAHEIRVGSRVGGRIAKVLVIEGQVVKGGAPLIELEPFDLHERLTGAQQVLAQRQAELARVQAGPRVEEIAQATARREQLQAQYENILHGARPLEIEEAQALSDQAAAQQVLAKSNYDRVARAFSTGTASRDEMDATTNQLRIAEVTAVVRSARLSLLKEGNRTEEIAAAKQQLEGAEQALTQLKNGSRVEEIAAAKAGVEAQQAAVGALEKGIAELVITAPADSTVEAVELRAGDLLPPNAPALTLLEANELWVRAYVPEKQVSKELDGKKVRVTVDAFPGRGFEGTISFVSRGAEFTPSNVQTPEERSKQVFRIRVTLTDAEKKLRAGMAADVWLKEAM